VRKPGRSPRSARWAVGYARTHGVRASSAGQFKAIDALAAEEINLADELRAAITDGDRGTLVQPLAVLGLFWIVRGEHARLLVLTEAVTDSVSDWRPPPDLMEDARGAVGVVLANALMSNRDGSEQLGDVLRRLGPGEDGEEPLAGLMRVLLAYDPADTEESIRRLERLTGDNERPTALTASQWLIHLRENAGDPAGAMAAARQALAPSREDDGPWGAAMAHAMLAELTLHADDRTAAILHARAALPVMARLGARDDETQLRALLVLCAVADDRLADAQDELTRLEGVGDPMDGNGVGGGMFSLVCRGELALARGDYPEGLRLFRQCAAVMREFRLPGVTSRGTEPWALSGESMALAAHARHTTGEDEAHGRELFRSCRERILKLCVLPGRAVHLDYPATGAALLALGTWVLLREGAPAEDGLRLLALADRFRYSRTIPTLLWERVLPIAEAAAPGRLAVFQDEYAASRPQDLLAEAYRLAERLPR
jgi:hypothetical protein